MVSGNDSAVALAEFISDNISNFSDSMNNKAIKLGLNSSHFTSPHGLDHENHYTTAFELALLTDYALKNDLFLKIVSTKNYTIMINNNPKNLSNTNELLGFMDGVYGVKTGFTNGANRCLVSAYKNNNLDIICVVLGCDTKKNRTQDSINLINYIINNFSVINIEYIINNNFNEWVKNNSSSFNIIKGTSKNLELKLDEKQIIYKEIPIHKKYTDTIQTLIQIQDSFQAPIISETIVGKLNVQTNESTLFTVNILAKNTIKRKNIFNYIDEFIKILNTSFFKS